MRYLLQMLKSGMKLNSAGGASWAVDDWQRMRRFLILGSEGGSYYSNERALSMENAMSVIRCLEADGERAVAEIVEVSDSGRAAKNDPAVFALALATTVPSAAAKAMDAIPRVCRTGTHLFNFVKAVRGCRGMGRALRRGIARWYVDRSPEELAYQLLKYRRRGNYNHRDVLRICHAVPPTPKHDALFRYAVRCKTPAAHKPGENLPDLVEAYERLRASSSAQEVVERIRAFPSLSWEMIPSSFLSHGSVWEALLPQLPMTALLRNLGRMTANGALREENVEAVCERLVDPRALAGSRLHPLSLLTALVAYRKGKSLGGLRWNPLPDVAEALNQAFYLSFGHVLPTGKRTLLALDVSGSMACPMKSLGGVSCRVASVAMAMVTARVERNFQIAAFCSQMVPLSVSPRMTLPQVLAMTDKLSFGPTDCAAPILWAARRGLKIDTFVVYTDNETWSGHISPCRALRDYRQKTGIPARLVVVGMVSNGFSIADPNDGGMMDVVGFDSAAPEAISNFARCEF